MTASDRRIGLLVIAVGAIAGAITRHALGVWLSAGFPWGTLAANTTGAFVLGAVISGTPVGQELSPESRLLVGTGFCSSLTTYSTFAAETRALSPELAALNVLGNYVLGFLAVVLGQFVARWYS